MSSAKDRLMDHQYDGIQEYDNPLPGWWSLLFILSIVFSGFYLLYYHVGEGPLVADEFQADQTALSARRAAEALTVEISNEGLLALANDAPSMSAAAEIFVAKCAVCHGPQGQGVIGPNLCDDYFLHGSEPVAIFKTISEGVPEKGMVAWAKQLPPGDIRILAAYVGTLRGTTPDKPKAPEGELAQ